MKFIITAGGTTEKIDPVRKITNTATGRLGSLTAEEFVRQGGRQVEKIYYVCEKGTVIPKSDCVEVVPVEGVKAVKDALENLLTSEKIDAVVHTMAVSDYTVSSLTSLENLSESLAEKLFTLNSENFQSKKSSAEFLMSCIRENDRNLDRSRKISSDIDDLILFLKPTSKLIGMIKKLQPSVILVGFKLLNQVDRQSLLDTAYGLLKKNSCDLVLANDSSEIDEKHHIGYLISPDKSFLRFQTKEEIACGIVRKVFNLMNREA